MENEREDLMDRNGRKDAIDAVLTALGRAKTPEGLEDRVAARLAQQARRAEFRWRDVLAGSALAGVWWRGAVCGVAVSMVVVGVVMLAEHFVWGPRVHSVREIASSVAPTHAAVIGVVAREDRRGDCASSSGLRVADAGVAQRHDGVRVAVAGVSLLMPGPPLTAEERGLVRLAKVGDLKQLASLNPEIREQLEAEDAAQFRSFFAEPVRPVPAEPAAQPTTVESAPEAGEPAAVEPSAIKPAAEPIAEPATESVTEPKSGENE